MSMTLDELRDWHARRMYIADIPSLSQKCRDGWDAAYFRRLDDNEMHPFPPTLDGAARAFQCNELEGWTWFRVGAFPAVTQWEALGLDRMTSVEVEDTGNEIFDRYLLAKKCLEEQEAAR